MGEELELYRDATKKVMKQNGLPVQPYKVIKGMTALREFLKTPESDGYWIKVNKWRGIFETFQNKGYRIIEPRLDEIQHDLGAFSELVTFVVDADLPDAVEIGVDGYTVDGKFPKKMVFGIEVKSMGYLGIFKDYAMIPEQVTRFDRKMSGVLEKFKYRGFYSTEIRIGRDKVPYMIDACCRAGSPPNELYQVMYENLGEILWEGSAGNVVDPICKYKYGAEIIIHSAWALKNWSPISIPEKSRPYVKLHNVMKTNGRYYIIPQSEGLEEVGAVVGVGNTMEAAMDMAKKVGESIEGYDLDIASPSLEKAQEQIRKISSFGIKVV